MCSPSQCTQRSHFVSCQQNKQVMRGSILPVTIPPGQSRGQVRPFGPGSGELLKAVLSRGEGGANRK